MQIRTFDEKVLQLKPILDSWISECNTEEMGIELDEEVYLKDLQRLVDDENCTLLVLEHENKIAGFMGLIIFDSPLGRQKIANEHYFYILPEYRGMSSLRLIRAARKWARENGCSHILMNASYMASELHDKVCKLYEWLGMKKFETTYLIRG
jgi:GNAT superfamily N-acetyltransferase